MHANDGQHRLAYAYALVAVVFWATAASAFKISLRHVGVMPLLLFASVTSVAVFFLYLAASGKLRLLRTFTKRDYLWSAGLGFLNPFLYYVVIFKAYSLLPAQEAQPINFVWPLTLVLLSIPILGQRIKLASILAILVSFPGVVVIATHPDAALRTSWTSDSAAVRAWRWPSAARSSGPCSGSSTRRTGTTKPSACS